MKSRLRALKSLGGPFPAFDPSSAPEEPQALFVAWLEDAIELDVMEPHAMTLSTVDHEGFADARVLILKHVDKKGWYFATSSAGPKGAQIEGNANVALTFYWPPLGRQVRIRGRAVATDADARDADFLARPIGSRASALIARQSEALVSPEDLETETSLALGRLSTSPHLVAPNWALYYVSPREIEFFQADTDRRHHRLRYRAEDKKWRRERLWP